MTAAQIRPQLLRRSASSALERHRHGSCYGTEQAHDDELWTGKEARTYVGLPERRRAAVRHTEPELIAVVIPAHDEEAVLDRCLASAVLLARDSLLGGEPVRIVVVLDSCADGSEEIAARFEVDVLEVDARNVGAARAIGAQHAIAAGARWLAFTDADTEVSGDWLSAQLALGADAVCGTIAVDDWSKHPAEVGARFVEHYVDACGHRHIHGANLGVSRDAYLAVGGFQPLISEEDVALVRALEDAGYAIAWTSTARVKTSARMIGRAPGGFADAIRKHREELQL